MPMSADKGFHTVWDVTPPSTPHYDTYAMTLPTRPDLHQFAGFAWYADHSSDGGGWNLLVPHRYFVLGGVVLLAYRLWLAYRARRRVRENHCAACGYDLRATPDRCPECGSVPIRPGRTREKSIVTPSSEPSPARVWGGVILFFGVGVAIAFTFAFCLVAGGGSVLEGIVFGSGVGAFGAWLVFNLFYRVLKLFRRLRRAPR